MQKLSTLQKVGIGFAVATPLLMSIATVMVVFTVINSHEFTFFGDIRGLNAGVNTRYDLVITRMGEPLSREITTHENGSETHALHYDGVTFFVRKGENIRTNNYRVTNFVIDGERYRLGGSARIGVGSTRAQVERDVERRQNANRITRDCSCSTLRVHVPETGDIYMELYALSVSIAFDENDIVT
ncbi:MAG: hypothetical protein FWC89_13760, partial [Defluviitaleaceae bacterium]|nr:hypothetical protein [Defluviitaleaceae bacterium]